jgi:hypothetical protein
MASFCQNWLRFGGLVLSRLRYKVVGHALVGDERVDGGPAGHGMFLPAGLVANRQPIHGHR